MSAPRLKPLVDQISRDIPAGVGASGQLRVLPAQIDEVLAKRGGVGNRGRVWVAGGH